MQNDNPWTKYNVAAVIERDKHPMRVATNGSRIRIRCGDMRFDPPIEMDVSDFQKIMAAAELIGLKASGDVVLERKDL